jgi:eukaryotic-like serine/threonine-protein kinase
MPDFQEEAIFDAARRIEAPEDRRSYVQQACGDDGALRARIEALLRVYHEERSFLHPPTAVFRAAAPSPVREGPGTRIGPYQLLEQLGEGAFGIVFLAEQTQAVRRQVALKVLKPGMDTRHVVARFEAERQALALMDHPHIARVLDGGETASGRPYFVMELVRGVPITDFCDQYHFTVRQRLELFVSVCQAVQHAHQKGVIHRDLKPSNVLVTRHDGAPVVKVIDFGVAKALGQHLTDKTLVTHTAQVMGTPLYMSPEQAAMGGRDVDTRTDVYALGVLLYELLTGTTPFDRERLRTVAFDELRRIIREEEPARPSARVNTLADVAATASANGRIDPPRLRRPFRGELDWVVMKCLEKDPARRYEMASELARDIQRYLNEEPVQACPPSAGYRLRKFVRRHHGPVLATSLVGLALVGGIIGTTWGLICATGAHAVAVQSEREATDQLFEALLNRARAGRFSRQMGQRLDSLAALAQAARIRPDERLRDEAMAAMALPDVRRGPGWQSTPPGTAAVAYGGQCRLYARADDEGVISIRSISDDQEVGRIPSGRPAPISLYFSPDERFLLAFGKADTLRVWRVADGQQALRDGLGGYGAHAFSPDGRQLAVGQQEGVLCFDLATGQEVKRWRLPARAHTLAFHPNSRKLAIGYTSSAVASVYDTESGALLTNLPVGASLNQVVAWHPDGERVAVGSSQPRIQIWNAAAKRKVTTLIGHGQNVTAVTFHPGGQLLASHSWDGDLRLWEPGTGRPLLQLPLAVAGRLRFSDDGLRLGVAVHGEQAELLEVTPNREYRTLVSSGGIGRGAYSPSDISPDGRLLAVGTVVGMEPGARLWDLRTGRELAALPLGTNFVCFAGQGAPEGLPLTHNRPCADLLTCGSDGLLRWSLTSGDPEGTRLRLGPPRQLSPLRRAWFARGPDGRTLGAVTEEGGPNQILDLESGAVQRELGKHPGGDVRALSGDGQWAASSGWHSDRFRLWNLRTGEMKERVVGTQTFVFFTPDSRALIISRGNEFSFWDVATFQPIRSFRREITSFPGHVAFSPDGRLMAVEMAPAVLHLKEVATGRTVAKLEDPHGDRATWQGFTPDGTQLVVVSGYAAAIHVWDLQAIRSRLKDMNLDWDWPELPPEVSGNPVAGPPTIEVVPGEAATREQRARQEIEHWRRKVEANPDSAPVCNNLAWAYLVAPEGLRDVKAALPLAEKAVRLEPGDANWRNTLGVAYYRAGRHREAVEVLRSNLDKQAEEILAFDLYFLAMSHHHLGETARARDYYRWAIRWTALQPELKAVYLEELSACRAEAEALLGIEGKKD